MTTYVPGRPIEFVDDEQLYPLGRYYIDFPSGKVYRYIKASGSISEGDALRWNTGDDWTVLRQKDGGLGTNAPAGIAVADMTNDDYGWIQVSGKAEGVRAQGTVNAGVSVKLDGATTDGAVIVIAGDDDEDECFGIALAEASSNKVTIMLKTLL